MVTSHISRRQRRQTLLKVCERNATAFWTIEWTHYMCRVQLKSQLVVWEISQRSLENPTWQPCENGGLTDLNVQVARRLLRREKKKNSRVVQRISCTFPVAGIESIRRRKRAKTAETWRRTKHFFLAFTFTLCSALFLSQNLISSVDFLLSCGFQKLKWWKIFRDGEIRATFGTFFVLISWFIDTIFFSWVV